MAKKAIYDPITKSYKYVDDNELLYDLSGGDPSQSVGSTFGPTSPGYAEMGVGLQNLGQTLSSVPGITTAIAGAVATGIGNSMMNSEVSPVANPTAPTETAISPMGITSENEDAAAAAAAAAASAAVSGAANEGSHGADGNDPGSDDDTGNDGEGDGSSTSGTGGEGGPGSDGGLYKGGHLMYYKDGGIASLAQKVQSKGRYGDTILAHINPQEAMLLKQLGGSGTINPHTGLPEFNIFSQAWKSVGKPVLKTAAKVAPFVLPFIPGFNMLAPAYQGLIAGGLGSMSSGKFNLKRGLMSGLTAYGLASLNQGLQAAGASASNPTATDIAASIEGTTPVIAETGAGSQAAMLAEQQAGMGAYGEQLLKESLGSIPGGTPTVTGTTFDRGVAALKDTGAGLEQLYTNPKAAMDAIGTEFGTKTAAATLMGGTGVMAADEAEKLKQEQEAIERANEERRQRQREIAFNVMRENPWRWKEGGAVGLRQGSFVVPADVVAHLGNGSSDAGLAALAKKYKANPIKGRGDGMSDSIHTTIDGTQKARVANGEAVIPPGVVKKVGADRLYAMMDKVRKARTGTVKQGKQINPAKYMPA